jgi:hypothetical protein
VFGLVLGCDSTADRPDEPEHDRAPHSTRARTTHLRTTKYDDGAPDGRHNQEKTEREDR